MINESQKTVKTAYTAVLFAKCEDLIDKEVLDHIRSQKKEI